MHRNTHGKKTVTAIPKVRGAAVDISFAKIHGMAIMKSSRNRDTAFIAVQKLLSPEYSGEFSSIYGLPPVRRDLLSVAPSDAILSVTYDLAIRAHSWLDPRPEISNKAFQEAIESISSGKSTAAASIITLNSELTSALNVYK